MRNTVRLTLSVEVIGTIIEGLKALRGMQDVDDRAYYNSIIDQIEDRCQKQGVVLKEETVESE